MADFSSLQQKVDALKSKIEQSSITPLYLGSLLDDFIAQMQSIDMTDLSDDVRSAVTNATAALQKANQALTASQNAANTAGSAAAAARTANDTASAANRTASDALSKAANALRVVTNIDDKLPALNKIIFFDRVVQDVAVTPAESSASSDSDGCSVVFNKSTNTFLIAVSTPGIAHPTYYNNWADANIFGSKSISGRVPFSGKFYVDNDAGMIYRWTGSAFRPLTYGIQPPIRCVDEADLATKAASGEYLEGQEFYIPEDD